MLYNSTRLETFLQLRLRINCLCGTALWTLSLSATYSKLGGEPSAPGTRDQTAMVLCCRKSLCHHSKPLLPLLTSSVSSCTPGMHPLQSHSNMFAQLGINVASSHMSEDKRIKGSNAGARIQSTASEGQTDPSQKIYESK